MARNLDATLLIHVVRQGVDGYGNTHTGDQQPFSSAPLDRSHLFPAARACHPCI